MNLMNYLDFSTDDGLLFGAYVCAPGWSWPQQVGVLFDVRSDVSACVRARPNPCLSVYDNRHQSRTPEMLHAYLLHIQCISYT